MDPSKWSNAQVRDVTRERTQKVSPETDSMEALRLLIAEDSEPLLLVAESGERVVGFVTKTTILQALKLRREVE